MTPPDPAALARRLSPAQAKALMWLPEDGCESTADPDIWCRHVAGLLELTTMSLCWSIDDGGWMLSPLGLAVRAELQRREAGDGG